MSLKDMASTAISSSPSTGIRSRKWPDAKRCAVREAERTGATICWDASHEMPISSTTTITAADAKMPRMSATVETSLSMFITR